MNAYPRLLENGSVEVRVRAEGDGFVGDMVRGVAPGENWAGIDFADWLSAAEAGKAVALPD